MKKLMLAIAPVVALGTASMFATFGPASAQTVGRATSVKPGVFRNSAPVGVGAPVVTDDLMNTDVQGRTNLRFIDQSDLDIGPGSDVKIDRFVYSPTLELTAPGGAKVKSTASASVRSPRSRW